MFLEDTQLSIDNGKKLFQSNSSFITSVVDKFSFPSLDLPEVAFCGRSNVGKSSLINAIFNQKISRVSNTPGRTTFINLFNANNMMVVADLPGYGFTNAPAEVSKRWVRLNNNYLAGRVELRRVFLLIDSRRGVGKKDDDVINLFEKNGMSWQIILTKIDKLTNKESENIIKKTNDLLLKYTALYPRILTTSSAKNIGIDNLKTTIGSLV